MEINTRFKPGTRFICNVNGAEIEVLEVFIGKVNGEEPLIKQNTSLWRFKHDFVALKDQTGRVFGYGLSALEHCDVTIL